MAGSGRCVGRISLVCCLSRFVSVVLHEPQELDPLSPGHSEATTPRFEPCHVGLGLMAFIHKKETVLLHSLYIYADPFS